MAENRLHLRFLPTDFDLDDKDPVLGIAVDIKTEIDKVEQNISGVKQECIVDIEADGSSVSIWPELADSPIQFFGSVTWSFEDYTTRDYIEQIKRQELDRDQQFEEYRQLSLTVDRTLRFIDQTIDRIEKKQLLTLSRNANDEKQLRLLRGIRRHLTDD